MGKRIIALILSALLLLPLVACGDNPAKYEKEIRELQEEIDDLKAENETLKKKLGLPAEETDTPDDRIVYETFGRAEMLDLINTWIADDNEYYDDYVAPLELDDLGGVTNGCDDYRFGVGLDADGNVNEAKISYNGHRETLPNGMDTVLAIKAYAIYLASAVLPEYADTVVAAIDNWFGCGTTASEYNDQYHYYFDWYAKDDYYSISVTVKRGNYFD